MQVHSDRLLPLYLPTFLLTRVTHYSDIVSHRLEHVHMLSHLMLQFGICWIRRVRNFICVGARPVASYHKPCTFAMTKILVLVTVAPDLEFPNPVPYSKD